MYTFLEYCFTSQIICVVQLSVVRNNLPLSLIIVRPLYGKLCENMFAHLGF
jgi:hypothetical protein